MKKLFSTLLAVCGALMLCAAPNAAQVYRAATRHIDFDGDSVLYYNSTELMGLINALPETVGRMVAVFDESGKSKIIIDASRIVFDALNLQALHAFASSEKELKKDLFLYKHSFYLGKDAQLPGIFSIAGINGNLSLQGALATLPSDLIIATQFQMLPGKFYQHVDATIKASKHEQINTLCDMFIQGAKIDIAKLLNSANGLFTVIVAGETMETFRFSVTIPDNDGVIAAELKKLLPPDPKTPGRSVLPCTAGHGKEAEFMRPEVVYLDKQIMVVSNFDRCLGKVHRPYAIKDDFLRLLPASGAGFNFINITPAMLENFKKAFKYKPVLVELLNIVSPGSVAEVVKVSQDGVYSIEAADFSYMSASFTFFQKLSAIINEANSKRVK